MISFVLCSLTKFINWSDGVVVAGEDERLGQV